MGGRVYTNAQELELRVWDEEEQDGRAIRK